MTEPRSPDREEPPLTEADISLAYRLILHREPDADGLRHYRQRAETGLTLVQLVRALRASDEYQTAKTLPADAPDDPDRVRPGDIIQQFTVEQLIETAEEYYRRIPDPAPLMSKPFTYWHEAPQMLHDLGLLLSGMHIGKTMTVLDFGGGTGWLSRILAQLNCQPICCDVSATALEIGRRLFETLPLIGTTPYAPKFLLFNGHRIDLPDQSVDRIICFDAFHHIPNAAEIIREFGRVLKPGGIVGLSEPGRRHSWSAQSQYEMKHHQVLENDIDVNEIFQYARSAGFTSLSLKALVDQELALSDYNVMFGDDAGSQDALRHEVWNHVVNTMHDRSIFFLHKGPLALDSRGHVGLAHSMSTGTSSHTLSSTEPLRLSFVVKNTGTATWLHENTEIFGIVRLATHLFDGDGHLFDLDFSRDNLPAGVAPGESISLSIDVRFPGPGSYRLVVDLVAEGVTWFENVGSKPVTVYAVVEEPGG